MNFRITLPGIAIVLAILNLAGAINISWWWIALLFLWFPTIILAMVVATSMYLISGFMIVSVFYSATAAGKWVEKNKNTISNALKKAEMKAAIKKVEKQLK